MERSFPCNCDMLQINSCKYKNQENNLAPALDDVLTPAKREKKTFQQVQIILWSIISCTARSREIKELGVFRVVKKDWADVSIYWSLISQWSSWWMQVSILLSLMKIWQHHLITWYLIFLQPLDGFSFSLDWEILFLCSKYGTSVRKEVSYLLWRKMPQIWLQGHLCMNKIT